MNLVTVFTSLLNAGLQPNWAWIAVLAVATPQSCIGAKFARLLPRHSDARSQHGLELYVHTYMKLRIQRGILGEPGRGTSFVQYRHAGWGIQTADKQYTEG
jgi:hypothetical protein